jgi:hypothetical protein
MTTWNPADLSNITLSGANLVATVASTANAFVRGTTSKTTGDKPYWEVTAGSIQDSNHFEGSGLANAAYTVSQNIPGYDSGSNSLIIDSGGAVAVASARHIIISPVLDGDILAHCYDITNDRLWVRIWRSGAWFAGWNDQVAGTQDPATGQGGFTPRGTLFLNNGPYFHVYGGLFVNTFETLNPGPTGLITEMPPTGFTAWDGGAAVGVNRDTRGNVDVSTSVVRGFASRTTKWIREAGDLYSRRRSGLFVPRGFFPVRT